MRVAFTADEGGFDADDDALVCGVAGEGHSLTIQRDAEGSDEEDRGIYLEYDDQSIGGYGCVAACRLGPGSLTVDLAGQLGRLAGVTGFDVALRLSPAQWSAVRDGLRRVFRGHPDMLAVAEPGAAPDTGRVSPFPDVSLTERPVQVHFVGRPPEDRPMPGGRYSVWALLPETSDFTVDEAIAHFRELRWGKVPLRAEPAPPRGQRKSPGFRVLFGDWAVSARLESGEAVLAASGDIAERDDLPAPAAVIAHCGRRLAVISDKDPRLDYGDQIGLVTDELRERFGAFIYDHVQDEWWS